jgi:hypothetical protein
VYILIDLAIDRVELAEPDDTHHFHVAVAHGTSDLETEAVIERAGIGRLDPNDDDHVWIEQGTVRELASGRVPGNWEEHFEKMLANGEKHGFYDPATQEIKAHVEWIVEEEEIEGFES